MLLGNGYYTTNLNYLGGVYKGYTDQKVNKNAVSNSLLWASEKMSLPPGRYTSAFIKSLQYGGIGAMLSGVCNISSIISAIADLKSDDNRVKGFGEVLSISYLAGGRNLTVTIDGLGVISVSNLTARALLKCLISIGALPSAFDIAQAVWGEKQAAFTNPESFGYKLDIPISDAGGSSAPTKEEIVNAIIDKTLTTPY